MFFVLSQILFTQVFSILKRDSWFWLETLNSLALSLDLHWHNNMDLVTYTIMSLNI